MGSPKAPKRTKGANVVHLADIVVAGVLGAAVLAIVLLARCVARNTRLITELRAELTAQKILALTNLPAAAGAEAEATDTVPVRARGHLALLAGTDEGGPAPRARFRGAWSTRYRNLTVTLAAATVFIGGGITAVALTIPGVGRDRGETSPSVAPGAPGKKEQQPPAGDCDATASRTGGPDPDDDNLPQHTLWHLEYHSAWVTDPATGDCPPAVVLAS